MKGNSTHLAFVFVMGCLQQFASAEPQGLLPIQVSSMSELRRISGELGAIAAVSGFRSAADGGQGTFDWVSSKFTDDGCVVVSSVNGSWVRRIGNLHWDFKWCGAYGDQQHDDTQAIQRTYDTAASYVANKLGSGVTIEPSPGIYLITSTVHISGSHIHTTSRWGDVSVSSIETNGDMFLVSAANTPVYDVTFDGVTFVKSGRTGSAGYAINFDYGSGFSVDRTDINGANKLYQGIRFSRTFQSRLENSTIQGTVAESVVLSGANATNFATSDIFINNVRSIGCQSSIAIKKSAQKVGCFRIDDFTGGLFFTGVEIFGSPNGYAFYFNTKLSHTEAGGQNGTAVFNNINSDASGKLCQGGFYIQNYSLVSISGGSWITAANCDDIVIEPTADHVLISSGTVLGVSQTDGSKPRAVYINGTNIMLQGVSLKAYSSGLGDAIYIDEQSNEVTVGGGTVIEDWSSGIHALTLKNKRYVLDGVRFVRTKIQGADLVGFGGNSNNEVTLSADSFAGYIRNLESSGISTRSYQASATLGLAAGADLYVVSGLTTINSITISYIGQRISMLMTTRGARVSVNGRGSGNIVSRSGADIITDRGNEVITFVSDGTSWFQTE